MFGPHDRFDSLRHYRTDMPYPSDARVPLSPARGLLHPAWLVCLALLVLNDHALKGSGLLPGVVTGKLSDVVGLFVAPLLFALVLRVRTDGGLVFAHVAVGVVFSAIQLSALAADAWTAATVLVGFPWVITRDPTDLLALPALAASWAVLRPALREPAARLARRSAETAVAGVGLLACVATSDPDPGPPEGPDPFPEGGTDDGRDDEADDGWLPDHNTDVYLHNALSVDLVARIRPLAPEADLDCDAIAAAPGSLVTAPLLGLTETWTLPPGTNQPVLSAPDGRECHAALVEIDGMSPKILFWREGDPPRHLVPGSGRVLEDDGEVAILPDPDGGMMWPGGVPILHDVVTSTAECAPQPDAARLSWSEPVPWGRARLEALSAGADGCWALHLQASGAGTDLWFLCVPEATMVLQPGDELDIAPPEADVPLAGVAITVLDETGAVLEPARRITVSAGEGVPRFSGLELAFVPDYDCDPEVQPVCGTVARPGHVSISAAGMGAVSLSPDGAAAVLESESRRFDLALMHAQERFAIDPGCALGPDTLGTDLELVVAERSPTR
jgi:hypothetical protein